MGNPSFKNHFNLMFILFTAYHTNALTLIYCYHILKPFKIIVSACVNAFTQNKRNLGLKSR